VDEHGVIGRQLELRRCGNELDRRAVRAKQRSGAWIFDRNSKLCFAGWLRTVEAYLESVSLEHCNGRAVCWREHQEPKSTPRREPIDGVLKVVTREYYLRSCHSGSVLVWDWALSPGGNRLPHLAARATPRVLISGSWLQLNWRAGPKRTSEDEHGN
jgi:hypothetical protein